MSSFRALTYIILILSILLFSGGLVSPSYERALLIPALSYLGSAGLYQGTGLNLPVSLIPPVKYDVQLGMTFTQDHPSLAYNVTAVAQSDTYGYGPAYLLNGVSNLGYWYQVGVAYNWPYKNKGGYTSGFNFVYEVFDSGGKSVFPVGGGGLLSFSGYVNSGDLVLLTLFFSSGNVVMYAKDWNTGAIASTTYGGKGATYFMGFSSSTQNKNQFFTGLMTEWYHVNPNSGSEQKVTYSNYGSPLSSAWMWIDEWDPSNPNWSGTWSDYTPSPVQYSSDPNQLRSFTSHNFTVASNAFEFITGYVGEATPVAGPYPFIPIIGVAVTVVTIITVIDAYFFILRRRRSNQKPTSLSYTTPTSQIVLSHPNFCPSCGEQLSPEEKFCHNCGRPLT
ncbi:MAG: zinc ribbon domain-containing protein [Candidatus Bathyarchaeota archaeon]